MLNDTSANDEGSTELKLAEIENETKYKDVMACTGVLVVLAVEVVLLVEECCGLFVVEVLDMVVRDTMLIAPVMAA